ncbi:MAG: SUMF1/EgtB/PvdO family nonheme iron enzyme [Pseudomonadota bacterium]
MRQLAMLLLGASIASCSSPRVTAVRLDLVFEESWDLTSFQLMVGERELTVGALSSVRLLVPDDWADQSLSISAFGLHASERLAYGETKAMPKLGEMATATVTLARLPCGAWCKPGTTTCVGNAVAVCEQRDDDQCLEWSQPVPCSADAPYCSLGKCATKCVDECASGERQCDGPGMAKLCGQADADSCRDWLPAVACATGETCSGGVCASSCHNECPRSESKCAGAGTVSCGDLNVDGCAEWSPITPCEEGTTCSSGECKTGCSDECSAPVCEGMVWRECGDFDADSCKDLSSGTSCVPADQCLEGTCTATGCQSTAKVCNEPPGARCLDADTKLVYDAVGTCADGACSYTSREVDCKGCPACDACAGVVCDDPPSVCYASPGTCTGGACSYRFADDATCDDGDACTTQDGCSSGRCSGTPLVCTTPPSSTCISASTVRTYHSPGTCAGGACGYAFTDTVCPSGVCSGQACCAPTTCAAVVAECGTISDGCGRTLNCGSCMSPETCGGSGKPNVCGETGGSFPSCAGLASTCGPTKTGDCCETLFVPSGTYNRSNHPDYPATVSGFMLDRFEITVGRFRKFVEAGMGTQANPPVAGAGAHPLIIEGSGWDSTWKANLPADTEALKTAVKCYSTYQTWTDTAGANENLPMNCLDWYALFAFCAWDGGRLPTEAEWNYAAAGGSEQRQYPWGSAAPDGTYAVYECMGDGSAAGTCAFTDILVVGSRSPKGDGRWGQSDLAGSMWEWTLDWYASSYSIVPCNDCANLVPASCRTGRGGSFIYNDDYLASPYRDYFAPTYRSRNVGGRCARSAP